MLRRILSAFAGTMALSGTAFAAEPLPPPVLPPPPQWTGFFVGLNAGGTWSNNNNVNVTTLNMVDPGPPPGPPPCITCGPDARGLGPDPSVPVAISGFIGGGGWGGNYQFNNWVVGAEGDFQGIASSNRTVTSFSQATAGIPPFAFPANQILAASRRLDWLGTERARIGFLIWPTFLVYGTGGLAYGETQASVALGQTIVGFSPGFSFGTFNQTLAGWTAGGGVEWLFYPNWSLKVEYLYYDLGRVTFAMSPLVNSALVGTQVTVGAPFASTRFNGNIVRAGLNYHFTVAPPPIVAKY
jgi:outer membrane immunogenic protein